MSQIVNLRAAQKTRDRAAKKTLADQNAAKFGRSKVTKDREAAKARRDLDGHERE